MRGSRRQTSSIAIFGHFGSANLGNESTLQALLAHLRRLRPEAEVVCICTGPEAAAATHGVDAIPISETFAQWWMPTNRALRAARRILVGLPSEPYRWVKAFARLRRTDALVIPGTGLLTDVDGLLGFGPGSVCKWTVIAKLARCKVLFVSVGAGPIYGALGRILVRLALALADFRSYRDVSTKEYLESIGFRTREDPVYPDLAFSLPELATKLQVRRNSDPRPVVGLGLMVYPGRLSVRKPSKETYTAYLDTLATTVEWLVARGYDIRLLIGDLQDKGATRELKGLLEKRLSRSAVEEHVIDEPISSVGELVSQIAATDIVVATRFHNAVLGLLADKPVVAIAFHHKCRSLMSSMGLAEYCVDIHGLRAETLIERIVEVELRADDLRAAIREKTEECRRALAEQYRLVFDDVLPETTIGAASRLSLHGRAPELRGGGWI